MVFWCLLQLGSEPYQIFPKSLLQPGAGLPPPPSRSLAAKVGQGAEGWSQVWEMSPWCSTLSHLSCGRWAVSQGMSLNLQLTKWNLHLFSQVFSKLQPFETEQNLLEASAQSFGGGYVKMPLVRSVILLRGVKHIREAANYLRHIAGVSMVLPHFLRRRRCRLSPQQTCFPACSCSNCRSQHHWDTKALQESSPQSSLWPGDTAVKKENEKDVSQESNNQQGKGRCFSTYCHFTRSQLHCQLHDALQGTWSPGHSPAFGTICPLFPAGQEYTPAQGKAMVISTTLCHELCCNIPSPPLPHRFPTCRKLY